MSDKILERVRLLMDKAEHVNTPAPEAELALKMANSLMAKHSIDEAIIRAGQTASQRRAPGSTFISFGEDRGTAEFWPVLRSVIGDIADANRCRGVANFRGVTLFGMAEDLAWVEMLYTTTYMQFMLELNPKWDASKGYDENVYNFKVAGYKWSDINNVAMANGEASREGTKAAREVHVSRLIWADRHEVVSIDGEFATIKEYTNFFHKMKAAYLRHAKKIGDDNLVTTQSHSEYRRQFADAFAHRISMRLWQMTKDNEAERDSTPGAALALVALSEDVKEAMWEKFPNLRPESPEQRAERRAAQAEQERAERQAREDKLNAMTPAQRVKFLEKEQAELRRERKRNEKAWQSQQKAHNASAHQRGRKAADGVDLSRKTYTDAAPARGAIG